MVNRQLVNEHMEKLRSGKIKRLQLNPDALKWTPLVSSQSLLEEEKNTENEVGLMCTLSKSKSFETIC